MQSNWDIAISYLTDWRLYVSAFIAYSVLFALGFFGKEESKAPPKKYSADKGLAHTLPVLAHPPPYPSLLTASSQHCSAAKVEGPVYCGGSRQTQHGEGSLDYR